MTKTNTTIVIALFAIVVAQSCKKEVYDVSIPEEVVVPEDDCVDVFYENGAKLIIDTKCATSGCHVDGTNAPGNYTDKDVVKSAMLSIKSAAVESDRMPLTGGPLSAADKESLENWIDCGGQFAPEDGEDPDPVKVSYQNEIKPIITANCAVSGCHVSTFTGKDFTKDADFETQAKNGAILNQVVTTKKMPKGGSLKQTEIDLIEKWLDEGAVID